MKQTKISLDFVFEHLDSNQPELTLEQAKEFIAAGCKAAKISNGYVWDVHFQEEPVGEVREEVMPAFYLNAYPARYLPADAFDTDLAANAYDADPAAILDRPGEPK